MATSVSPDGVATAYGYDSLGRLAVQSWVLGSEIGGAIARTYDVHNRMRTIEYPKISDERTVVRYRYSDNDGSFLGLQDDLAPDNNDADPQNDDFHFRVDLRDEQGRRIEERFSNGVVTKREYDKQRGWMTKMDVTGANGSTLFDQDFSYGASGNLDHRRLRRTGMPTIYEQFAHDLLDRIESWTRHEVDASGSPQMGVHWKVHYTHDAAGNLTRRQLYGANDLVTPAEDAVFNYGAPLQPQPHGVRSRVVNGSLLGSYQYDAAGRQWSRPNQMVVYNELDLPRRIDVMDEAGYQAYFHYAPDGSRYRKRVDKGPLLQVVTTYLGGLYEKREENGMGGLNPTTHVFYLQAGDRIVGQLTRTEPYVATVRSTYFHQDHLDTVSFTSDDAGLTEGPVYHDPFGNRYDPDGLPTIEGTRPAGHTGVTLGFTGHEMEIEDFGLINMRGRMFDPVVARFLSADPIVQAPNWSQNYNRYMYVLGNPMTYSDPTGFCYSDSGNWVGCGSYKEEIETNIILTQAKNDKLAFQSERKQMIALNKMYDDAYQAGEEERAAENQGKTIAAQSEKEGNVTTSQPGMTADRSTANRSKERKEARFTHAARFDNPEDAVRFAGQQAAEAADQAHQDALKGDPTAGYVEYQSAVFSHKEHPGQYFVGPAVPSGPQMAGPSAQSDPNAALHETPATTTVTVIGLVHSHLPGDATFSPTDEKDIKTIQGLKQPFLFGRTRAEARRVDIRYYGFGYRPVNSGSYRTTLRKIR